MHKPNAKSASEIGCVNEPLYGTLYSQKRIIFNNNFKNKKGDFIFKQSYDIQHYLLKFIVATKANYGQT